MTIKGIIFDFDGLICDTETPELRAWQELFIKHSFTFPLEKYYESVGAIHNDDTPLLLLEEMLAQPINRSEVMDEFFIYRNNLIDKEPLRPGILKYLHAARDLKLYIGLASSSPRSWIDFHLKRLSIEGFFECIKTFDDVSKTKPDPELFIKTVKCMQLEPHEVVALEDSLNGVSAAKKAGISVVVFPNLVTSYFNFENADLIVESLEKMPLKELLKLLNNF